MMRKTYPTTLAHAVDTHGARALKAGALSLIVVPIDPQPSPMPGRIWIRHTPGTRSFELHQGARFSGDSFIWSERMQHVDTWAAPGDRIWVMEACRTFIALDGGCEAVVRYAVDPNYELLPRRIGHWEVEALTAGRMPRWASRYTFTVRGVRLLQVHELTHADAIATGINEAMPEAVAVSSPVAAMGVLWDITRQKPTWASNPWAAAYTVEVYDCNIDAMPERSPPAKVAG